MTITKQDLFPNGVELTCISVIEAAMCEDVMEIFVESTNLTNNEGNSLFQPPTWEVIHNNFAQVFGLKVAERMGTKAFLMNISSIVPSLPVTTLVRLEGTKVYALSPGTLEARKNILIAFKPKKQVEKKVEEVVEEKTTTVVLGAEPRTTKRKKKKVETN